jgi:RHS repeat-associated protein
LSYLNARYYDSGRGQFLSEDPVFLGEPKQQDLANPQNLDSYSYAVDNPIVKKDPSGRIAVMDDVISFGVGGTINLGIYTLTNAVTRQPLTWGGASGAFMMGGIIGWAIDNAPETGGGSIAATLAAVKYAGKVGAAAGFVGNGTKQLIDVNSGAQKDGYNWGDLALSPVQGATSAALAEGAFPAADIPWLSAGRGSWAGIGKQVATNLRNGTIQNISASTAFKSAIGAQAAGAYKTAGGAAWDAGSSFIASASVTSISTWMGSFNPFMPHK